MDHSCFATLLCLYSVVIPVLSLDCPQTQYEWPVDNPKFCCNKCPPGQYMYSREEEKCSISCKPCVGERYTDSYNVEECKVCNNCNKTRMETVTPCTKTHNAVCRCKAGYTCEDEECTDCIRVPVVTQPPTPTTTTQPLSTKVSTHKVLSTPMASTSTTTTSTTTAKPVQGKVTDTAWFLIIISLLCLGLALVIVTKMKPLLSWFRRHKGHCLVEKPSAVLVSVPTEEEEEAEEEEEPSTPVQEMCGKCDQPIDVWDETKTKNCP